MINTVKNPRQNKINEIEKKVDDNAEYIKKMADLIKLSNSKNDFDDFKTISRWRDYINYVDHDLILLTYALNFCLVNFDKLLLILSISLPFLPITNPGLDV